MLHKSVAFGVGSGVHSAGDLKLWGVETLQRFAQEAMQCHLGMLMNGEIEVQQTKGSSTWTYPSSDSI